MAVSQPPPVNSRPGLAAAVRPLVTGELVFVAESHPATAAAV